ncbi:MAG TPA: alkaline phosphatase family protein [Candidatus Cybelea sp.]|nr:alkaline phosphatase family protein [Candidatus Cybelea sp.]
MGATVALCAFSACRGGNGFVSSPVPAVGDSADALDAIAPLVSKGKIKHVIIIVQENRSFNNLFYGYPGAMTQSYGYTTKGKKIALQSVSIATKWDLEHNPNGFLAACNGTGKIPGTDCRMNGFDKEYWKCGPGTTGGPCPIKLPPYAYVPQSQVQPYFDMAKQYVLADQMYASNFDSESFISYQYIIAAVNPKKSVGSPYAQWGCPGGGADQIKILGPNRTLNGGTERPCWNPQTLGDELDAKKISWAFYAVSLGGKQSVGPDSGSGQHGIWSAYQAIQHIYKGSDWKSDVISPPEQFITDVNEGQLRAVSWVTPTFLNSDHGGNNSTTGPSWVASLVNTIGQSQYWDSSVIFIFWDDYGGWYDPEPPKYLDNDGLGFRLPMLIISPYARQGLVSHVHYEHGSILRFVEDQFGLGRLAASDARAKSPQRYVFDFNQAPRKFVPFSAPYDANYFLHQPQDGRAPDSD